MLHRKKLIMLKAVDLRIGNLVKFRWAIIKVDSIDRSGINLKSVYNKYACQDQVVSRVKFKDMNPIPLTEEWLFKFRFEVAPDREYGGYLSPKVNGQQIRIRINTIGVHFYTPNNRAKPLYIDFVHELQNLIFVLTKTDLCIKD